MSSPRVTGAVLLAFGGVVALAWVLAAQDFAWAEWRAASCMPERCFCERLRAGTVRQPANTWSNLGFVFAGLWILGLANEDGARRGVTARIAAAPVYSVLYGVVLVFNGLGSMFYHASLTFAGQWFDVIAMYLLATFYILYNLGRLVAIRPAAFAASYAAANGALGWMLIAAPAARRYVFAALILLALASELLARRRSAPDGRLLAAAVGALAVAFAVWVLDLTHVLCAPESLLQGHAVWHLLCATSAALMYAYYRSEG